MGREGRDVRICIDRGGTFTDVYAEIPGPAGVSGAGPTSRSLKLLSEDPANYDDAPREGIRRILEEVLGRHVSRSEKLPTDRIDWIRMGTTVGTNALLERKGARTALCVTLGLRDLLKIGNQSRPNIFDLKVRMPGLLYDTVVEIEERVVLVQDDIPPAPGCERVKGLSGQFLDVVKPLNMHSATETLSSLKEQGYDSLAIVFMHSYTFPDHELAFADLAKKMGFSQVSVSSSLVPMVRAVPRGHTACVDAYLTPKIRDYVTRFLSGFDEGLKDVSVSFMQSDGGLTPAHSFTGFLAILSGPAGGVVGYAKTTHQVETEDPVIGFDMGGTSTDVSRFDGNFKQVFETTTAGVIVQAPQLDINTVAAGGGSKLKFEAGVFKVGPESVGAHPGPACYRKGGELAVTDANLVLGRIIPKYFPHIFGPNEDLPLDTDASRAAFEALDKDMAADQSGAVMSVEETALGFLEVANEAMCRPIRELTEMRGYETSKHTLACFGGAGPQHGCAIARALKIRRVVVHRLCGILSAYGMGLADEVTEAQEPCAVEYGQNTVGALLDRAKALDERVRERLRDRGFDDGSISTTALLNLRFEGTDTAIMVAGPVGIGVPTDFKFDEEFKKEFRREYGFELQGREILVDDVRVKGIGTSRILLPSTIPEGSGQPEKENIEHKVYFRGYGWTDTPVYLLEKLGAGHKIDGPAIILNGVSTILVEPEWCADVTKFGNVRLEAVTIPQNSRLGGEEGGVPVQHGVRVGPELDVVQLSIFANRFMGIAEQMGRTLQRTSVSTNIKERLDFSCALFAPDGGLVANAPHVPVHLGAMSDTVRWQIQHYRDQERGGGEGLLPGDVLVTNHPATGGSHLPDITVVTPVFDGADVIFFVASRGHHSEIGGITPGSMPPFSKYLEEEGAAIKTLKLVKGGEFQEDAIRRVLLQDKTLEDGRKVPGSRRVEDNISDLRAQVAANQRGITLIGELVAEYGLDVVQAYMGHVQANAEHVVRDMLKKVAQRFSQPSADAPTNPVPPRVTLSAEDFMDDGSRVALCLEIDSEKGEAVFDFSGTGSEVMGNWNSPHAVTSAAVIYCLRCLVDMEIPLNQGCLAPVSISIPSGSLLLPSDHAAVVGGNVLTSQRVTDVILSAFGACANSQGCMNNVTFGDGSFGYYETVAGGSGAGPTWDGTSAVQCHMTNTRMTDPEIFERRYPVILHKFGVREGSGGQGKHRGGDGVIREIEFRRPVVLSILTERRALAPKGMAGGMNGARGMNLLRRRDGHVVNIGGKSSVDVLAGETLLLHTPGGGGWGKA